MPKSAIKFSLSGRTAFFKKPDVNEYAYFTYNNVHKVVLLGMLGAIIGLNGYVSQAESDVYPEFYDKLKDLKITIVPDKKVKGLYPKKIQTFNNSVGYASAEEGGNLIVREQWLENPSWTIYILNNDDIAESIYNKLAEYLLNRKTVYVPYLGKNEHPAVIEDVEIVELQENKLDYIDSIFIKEDAEIDEFYCRDNVGYLINEMAPYKLQKEYNFYEYKDFVYTNYNIANIKEIKNLYNDKELSLYFY